MKYGKDIPDTVLLDENGSKQVLKNISSNAIKCTKINGKIEIFAINHKKNRNINDELKSLSNSIILPFPDDKFKDLDNSLIVAVSDSGIGIGQGDMKELFNKFKQLGNKSETSVRGTGLGLAIAKGIIEQHGGKIGAESEYGVGSMFYFVLPLK